MKKFNKQRVSEMAGLAAGAVVAGKVSNIKLPIALPPVVQAAVPLLLGVFLSGRKGFIGDMGKGMIAAGSIKVIGAVAPSLGIGDSMDDAAINDYMIEGAADTYALAGATMGATSYALAGMDEKDSAKFG